MKSYTFADFVKGRIPKKEYDKICDKADKLQQENLGRIADWSPDYEYDIKWNKPTKDQELINWLRSENAYLRGQLAAYEKFLKDKGYIEEVE